MVSDSLAERLKALGMKLGYDGLGHKERNGIRSDVMKSELGLTELNTVFGTALFTERELIIDPALFQFKDDSYNATVSEAMDLIARWTNLGSLGSLSYSNIVFLDTETTGLVGGTGTLVFLVGLGFFLDGKFKVVQIFLDNPDDEVSFLSAVSQFLSPFKLIVTYNGKSFDIPLLTSRYILNNLVPPFSDYPHLDFLHVARKLWSNRLPSRRLVDLEVSLLHIARTSEEIAGYKIPDIYFDYLDQGVSDLLPNVFYHNSMDIYSLAALLNIGSNLTSRNFRESHKVDQRDLVSIARIHEEILDEQEASALYELGLNSDLPIGLYSKTIRRLGKLYKKRGEWDRAVDLWVDASGKDLNSCIELAKYYEHQKKDYPNARVWAEAALGIIMMDDQNGNIQAKEKKDLEIRLKRIIKKLGMDIA
jgi:uncharacterized protein